jgi:hypothetical protein
MIADFGELKTHLFYLSMARGGILHRPGRERIAWPAAPQTSTNADHICTSRRAGDPRIIGVLRYRYSMAYSVTDLRILEDFT